MSTMGMKQLASSLPGRFAVAVFVLAVPSIAFAQDSTCLPVPNQTAPAPTSVQLQVLVSDPTDPTPIIIDSIGADLDLLQGVTLPQAPDAAGTAVNNGGTSLVIQAVSPSVAATDPNQAPVGTTADLTLSGGATSGLDSSGNPCSLVSTNDPGKSANPLIAATNAIFPVQTLSSAVFTPPATGTFFGLALENPDLADSVVSIDLWDGGSVVASASLALPAGTTVSRDVSELFPGVVPGAGSFFQVTATVPVQMVGLSGDATAGSVTPVLPALASP
jgi:hypothetical protein